MDEIPKVNSGDIFLHNKSLVIPGIQCGNIELISSSITINGIVEGNIYIDNNSSAIINGAVTGNIVGTGNLTIYGVLSGTIATTVNTDVRPSAIINNPENK